MRFLTLLIPILALAESPDVQVLRWISPDSSKPRTFHDWRASLPPSSAWSVKRIASDGHSFDDRVDVLVEAGLLPSLQVDIDTLLSDLANAGYAARAFSVSGSSPESLKAFLKAEYDSGLVAATLVGDLPVAWFQLIDDWNNNGRRDPDEGYEEFPCDLYFMDLDGLWQDNWVRYDTFDSLIPGQDSIYDTHTGNLEPEIGITRLYASTIGPQDSLIRSYLRRCHRYRTGQLTVTDRALVYIDDDWTPWANQWNGHVGYLYSERVFIADSEQTRVRDYKPRIDTAAYQWIQLCSHSWPGGHAMKFNHGQSWDWFYAETIPRINPEACFYNLFACSNVRFIERGYCGGRYVFQTSNGLGAIGSTKTGSMLEFQDYYLPLANDATLASAFRSWFSQQAQGGFEPWERSWFYGMTQIGEAMLKPRLQVAVEEQETKWRRPVTDWIRLRSSLVRDRLAIEMLQPEPSTAIRIADAAGRILLSLSANRAAPGSDLINLDVSFLTPGTYFILADSPTASRRLPFVRIP